jgi:hypothetical protein
VLEFGAGKSTLWWAKKVAWVLALESNDEWFTPTAAEPPYERVPSPDSRRPRGYREITSPRTVRNRCD